ncbi:hypothetical protein PT974_12433 [Cladobotryum mycophilum]|uniref:Uncharacterized protein n=1 Tax=Cladobotryum mycophilum TaxID=491253 RepID=A0ABR0S7Z7_9HYPO
MNSSYTPVHFTDVDDDEEIREKRKIPMQWQFFRFPLRPLLARRTSHFWLNLWTLFNAVFSVVLLLVAVSLMKESKGSTNRPAPVYSPVREDGADIYINTQYKPNKLFQSPPSDEVDEAWHGWLREYDHLFMFPQEKAKAVGLPETIELYNDPGYGAYGLGVYHQMHCLNRIRKTFYPERYYPNETQHEVMHHTHHCFDVLRQALLCHGDISVVYWWNQNYTHLDQHGNRKYTEEYLRMTSEERATGSFVKWDSQLQCRDMDAVNAWAKSKQDIDIFLAGSVISHQPKRQLPLSDTAFMTKFEAVSGVTYKSLSTGAVIPIGFLNVNHSLQQQFHGINYHKHSHQTTELHFNTIAMEDVPLIDPSFVSTDIHVGSLDELQPTATEGLFFLKEFLKRYDSLGPCYDEEALPLERLIDNGAFFNIDNAVIRKDQKVGMVRVRAKLGGASKITRTVTEARDHLLTNRNRCIDFESLTTTVF